MNGALIVEAGELAAAVKYVARWLAARPAIPAHAGILAEVNGGQLHLSGFNETASGRATVTLDERSDAEGRFVVSGRLLDSVVALLGNKPVTLEQGESVIDLMSGSFRAQLPVMSENDYPALPGVAPIAGLVNGATLADAVRRVAAAVARDPKIGAVWLGMHIAFNYDEMILTASNRTQMAQQAIRWEPVDGPEPFLAPAAVLVDAMDAFAESGEVEVGYGSGIVSLSTSSRALTSTLIATTGGQEFPAAQLRPIFDMERDTHVTFRVKDASLPLKRIDLLKNKESEAVTLTLRPGTLELAADAGEAGGSGNDEIPADYDGPEVTQVLRSSALHAALSSAPGDAVTLSLVAGSFKPVLLTSDADPTWRHCIAPIRPLGGTP